MYAIEIQDLTVSYQEKAVLWDIDVSIPKGILIAIVGPNGAGKTTLIRTILGLIKPAAGKVLINGRSFKDEQKFVGYVPQRKSVDWDFPVNVLDVVLMGRYGHLGWFKRVNKHEKMIASRYLDMVGMADFAHCHISSLSGGQQQRVFLARALAQESQLYFMDEPFIGVDVTTELAIVSILKNLRDEGKTVVVVHHDLQTLEEYFDWVFFLNVRCIAIGPIKHVLNEENLRLTYGGRSVSSSYPV